MSTSPNTDETVLLSPHPCGDSVTSTPISLSNRAGKMIAAILDRPSSENINAAVIVLVPGYGKTKSSHLRLAYYLALNGYWVIRYDHSNHVGESEGPMLFTTLSQMDEDLSSIIDYAEKHHPGSSIGVVAESLGARVALKRSSLDKRVSFFVSMIGVFDVQETLRAIYDEDGFVERLNGIELGIRDIMGFQVDSDRFIDDAYRSAFYSLDTSLQDAAKLTIPTFLFVAEKDPWVTQASVQAIFDHANRRVAFIDHIRNEKKDYKIGENTFDPLSSFYFIRTKKYEVGKSIYVDIFDSKKLWNVEVRVLRKERIKTKLGQFDTVVIKPLMKSEGIFNRKGDMYIWLTDDLRRIPVKMQTKAAVGYITATLTGGSY